MRIAFLLPLAIAIGCASRPTLEELEDKATDTGNWDAVERREEIEKKELESRGPSCGPKLNKYCVEEQTGIECYCIPETIIRE